MGGIVGERLPQWVSDQVTVRQAIQGKALDGVKRSSTDLNYLNNRDAWLKMASGVFLENGPNSIHQNPDSDSLSEFGAGIKYPMKYVLFNGRTGYTNPDRDTGQITSTTDTFSESEMASGIGKHGAYDTWDKGDNIPEFGVVPMPGIISCDVKNKNRGSIREANVKIKAHNKQQFTLIEEIYLRLGYDMIIEWGWNQYIDNKGVYSKMDTTLIEEQWFGKEDVDYLYWLVEIEEMRKRYNGNYGGFFGKVSNFKWDFQPDGSYDIQIKLISHGDVIESLRTVPSKQIVGMSSRTTIDNFYVNNVANDETINSLLDIYPPVKVSLDAEKTKKEDKCLSFGMYEFTDEIYGGPENSKVDGKDNSKEITKSTVSAYKLDLSPIKDRITEHVYNLIVLGYGINNHEMYVQGETKWYEQFFAGVIAVLGGVLVGTILAPVALIVGPAAGVLIYNALDKWMYDKESTYFELAPCGWKPLTSVIDQDKSFVGFGDGPYKGKVMGKLFFGQKNEKRVTPEGKTLPYENIDNRDAFFLYYHPKDDDHSDAKTPDFDPLEMRTYIRLGYLLEFIANEGIVINEKTGNPIVNIESGPIPMYVPKDTNLTYSYNPHNIILPTMKHNWNVLYEDVEKDADGKDITVVKRSEVTSFTDSTNGVELSSKDCFWGLNGALLSADGTKYIDARNLYLRGGYILDQIPIAANDTNEMRIDLHGFLKNICQDINQALGGINNLEPMIDEDTNTLYMMDSTNFPEREKLFKYLGINLPDADKEATFELFAYKGSEPNVSNFMRDVNITTKISKEMATMITVGATAKGSAPSTDATAFSKFNSGKINRFASNFINPKKEARDLKKEAAEKFYKNQVRKAMQEGKIGNELRKAKEQALKFAKMISKDVSDLTDSLPLMFQQACMDNSAAMYGFEGGVVDRQITWTARMSKHISTAYGKSDYAQTVHPQSYYMEKGAYGMWGHPKYPLWRISPEACSKNMRSISELYAVHEAIKYRDSKKGGSPSIGFIPFEMSMTADGISGIKIYNGIKTDTQFLPHNYPKTLEFITKGVDHKISNNDWVTTITTIAVPRTVDAEDTDQNIEDVGRGWTSTTRSENIVLPPPENNESEGDGGPGGGSGEGDTTYTPSSEGEIKKLQDSLKCNEESYNRIKKAVTNTTFKISGNEYKDGDLKFKKLYKKNLKVKGEWNDNEPQILAVRNAVVNKNGISNNPTADLLVLCYINKDGNKCVKTWAWNCNTYMYNSRRIEFPQQMRNSYDYGIYINKSRKNRGNALIERAHVYVEKCDWVKDSSGNKTTPNPYLGKDVGYKKSNKRKNVEAKFSYDEVDFPGMHMHQGYPGGVNNWSEGCFTFPNKSTHLSFFKTLTNDVKGNTASQIIGNNGLTNKLQVSPSSLKKKGSSDPLKNSSAWTNFPKTCWGGYGKYYNTSGAPNVESNPKPGLFTITCIYSDQIPIS